MSISELDVLQWPAHRVFGWIDHFQLYPPSPEIADLLMGIVARMEALGGMKKNTRSLRWNISRFFAAPPKKAKKKKDKKFWKGLKIDAGQ